MKFSRLLTSAIPLLLAAFALNAPAQQAVTFPSGDSTGQGSSICRRAPDRTRL